MQVRRQKSDIFKILKEKKSILYPVKISLKNDGKRNTSRQTKAEIIHFVAPVGWLYYKEVLQAEV